MCGTHKSAAITEENMKGKMSFQLCSGKNVPEYMQSSFIQAGYRVDYHWKACLKSLFRYVISAKVCELRMSGTLA